MDDKYLQYEITDFLIDDDFVNWALHGQNEESWSSWLKKNQSHTEVVAQAKKSVQGLQFINEATSIEEKNDLWARIESSTSTTEISLRQSQNRVIYGWLAVVAAVVLLVITMLPQNATTITTELAESEVLLLPAKSTVVLSAYSELSYNDQDWGEHRSVTLSGQAHFKVSKGVPFDIETSNGQVKVLGTEFDVLSRDETFQVLVTEGVVKVTSGTLQKTLTQGMAFYKNPIASDGSNNQTKWSSQDALYVFDQQPLENILATLEDIYDVSLDVGNIDALSAYTGSFDSTVDMEITFQKVFWPLRIDYVVSGNQVRLSSKE